MSLPSSIKLFKLSNSTHINSRRLSIVANLTNKLNRNQELNNSTTKQTNHPNEFTLVQNDEKYKQQQNVQQIDNLIKNNNLEKSSSNSSINLLSSINSSNDIRSNPIDIYNLIMGSSNSKCANYTDTKQPSNQYLNNGWINSHNCHPPQLNQPYLHHTCSMINLSASDYVCCHSCVHHDATVNYNNLNNNNLPTYKTNYQPNCSLNFNHHCSNNKLNNSVSKFDQQNYKDPYWLQQAKKSNKLARKDQKFGLFSRNLLNMGIIEQQQQSKAQYHTNVVSGYDLLREPNLNKDLAYTHKEREKLGIKGLIPPAVRSQELQARIAIEQFRKLDGSLKKYMYLRDLQDFNKRLFYRLLIEYVEELMPIVYTPVVGDACLKYSELYKRPRGLFITKHDIGHVHEILNNWPEKDIKAIVVTDGERILGLGDLGANGMGIPVGKLALYSALASIPPHLTLPVTLDVGTNNEKLINSEFYIGLKEPRERGALYDKLLDEFMEAVVRKWGRTCLIQFEDFGNSNAFKLLQKYRNHYCVFNDDIQGTASVATAGIIAACKRMKKKISQQKFLFMGAGGAALGISDLLVMAMEADGLTNEQAVNNIYLIDSKGLVSKDRENETDAHKMIYAKQLPNYQDLEKIVDIVKPTALIGVCAQPAVFTPRVLQKMAQFNESPIIFPLSNPTSKAECTAEQAIINTDGKCIFASGSPFDIIKYKNQTFIPGQGNNSYIFPGIALAVMSCSVNTIPEETFLVAARALADQITPEEFNEGRIYPSLKKIQQVSVKIATKVAQYFFNQGLSNIRPEPEDKELFIRQHQYVYEYDH